MWIGMWTSVQSATDTAGGQREGAPPPGSAPAVMRRGSEDLAGRRHLHREHRLALVEEPDADLMGSDGTDGLVQADVAAIDHDPGLGRDRLGDVGGGGRAERLALRGRRGP